jgi:hypothetical protein
VIIESPREVRPRPVEFGRQPVAPPPLHLANVEDEEGKLVEGDEDDGYEGMPDEIIVPFIKNSKATLQQYARFKGLSDEGTKQDLVDRIKE